jgi:hypothetical protein
LIIAWLRDDPLADYASQQIEKTVEYEGHADEARISSPRAASSLIAEVMLSALAASVHRIFGTTGLNFLGRLPVNPVVRAILASVCNQRERGGDKPSECSDTDAGDEGRCRQQVSRSEYGRKDVAPQKPCFQTPFTGFET